MTRLCRLFGHRRSRDAAVDGAYYVESTERRRIVAPHAHLCGITDVGRERDHKEDTFAIAEEGRLLVVADGLGGHAAGGGDLYASLLIDSPHPNLLPQGEGTYYFPVVVLFNIWHVSI